MVQSDAGSEAAVVDLPETERDVCHDAADRIASTGHEQRLLRFCRVMDEVITQEARRLTDLMFKGIETAELTKCNTSGSVLQSSPRLQHSFVHEIIVALAKVLAPEPAMVSCI